ncbi:MAG: DUF554 domain-containing protein [Clostridia bacterium]|nr:DUF554 domain-containing protein [Clostridia bacterium]
MPGLGTIINIAAIIVGGLAGLLFGKRLPERVQETLNAACGVATMFLGIAGAMGKMLTIPGEDLASGGSLMVVLSLALGGFLGALLDLDGRMVRLGAWLKRKTGNENDSGFIGGFVTASLTVCIGAMAVVGAIQDGLYGDHSTLVTKAILDFVIILVMSASLGKGCLFSFIPVGVFQGTFTLLSRLLAPIMTAAASANLSLVGSILIFCVGLNLIFGPKIKTANLLPSLIFAVAWALVL